MIIVIFLLLFVIILTIPLQIPEQHLTSEDAKKEDLYKPEKCPTCGNTNITRDDSYGGLG